MTCHLLCGLQATILIRPLSGVVQNTAELSEAARLAYCLRVMAFDARPCPRETVPLPLDDGT